MPCNITTCRCKNAAKKESCEIEISRGATPLLVFDVDVDLREANVYVVFSQKGTVVTEKTGDDLTVEETSISCKLTQEDTIGMRVGDVEIQIIYIFESGDRDNSNILHANVTKCLKNGVIEYIDEAGDQNESDI